MTIVVAVKVFDGLVIAADSATSLGLNHLDANGTVVLDANGVPLTSGYQVYNNAEEIFHLHRDLPIGLATWGGSSG